MLYYKAILSTILSGSAALLNMVGLASSYWITAYGNRVHIGLFEACFPKYDCFNTERYERGKVRAVRGLVICGLLAEVVSTGLKIAFIVRSRVEVASSFWCLVAFVIDVLTGVAVFLGTMIAINIAFNFTPLNSWELSWSWGLCFFSVILTAAAAALIYFARKDAIVQSRVVTNRVVKNRGEVSSKRTATRTTRISTVS